MRTAVPPDPGQLVLMVALSHVASLAVTLLGGVVLVGWVLGVGMLTSLLPGGLPMNPLTAVAFTISGLSLYLLRPVVDPGRSLRLSTRWARPA